MKTLPYTPEESETARKLWKLSCGHHSIAAACQVSLEEVAMACPRWTGWMNPTMIGQTLKKLAMRWERALASPVMNRPPDEIKAVMRIQFEGPWLRPAVPVKAAYAHTHYIAVGGGNVLDTLTDPHALIDWDLWRAGFDQVLAEEKPKATGWHFTDIWTVE